MHRAYSLAGDSNLVGLRRAAYCKRQGCPLMHDLARLLGRPRSTLGFLAEACPDMTDHRCQLWASSLADGARYLGDETAPPAVAQELELRFWFAEDGDPRPWVVVEVGDKAAWAIIDTADYRLSLEETWALDAHTDFRTVDRPYHRQTSDGEYRLHADGVLHGFRMGTLELGRVAARMVSWRDHTLWFGMNILLRYDAVCFSWPDEPSGAGTLHLGELGPCRGAEAAERAFLHPRTGQPHVEVAVDGQTRLPALVDTGAIETDCKGDFMARHGQAALSFGVHRALTTRRCADLYPVNPYHSYAVRIGMDTLLQFKAFGWELDPFRMYFLPRDG